jgi:hypothetical protein
MNTYKRAEIKNETDKFALQIEKKSNNGDLLCVGPHQVLDPLDEEILVHLEEQELAQHRVRLVKALSGTGNCFIFSLLPVPTAYLRTWFGMISIS